MAIATGVAKRVYYKVESVLGTAPGTGSGQALRRVSSNLSLKKATHQSNEIRSSYQMADMRHGVRSVEGSINGELSPGTYKDFIAAAVRKAFATVTAITGMSITVAGAGPTYTVTRAAGSFLSDGVKAGDVWRLTAGSFNAANLNKNLFVLSLTATVLTAMPLNGVALVAEGPIAAATLSLPGKKTFVPTTGHTDLSFAVEHYYADVAQSELFLGCKPKQIDIKLPVTGMATVDTQFLGIDVQSSGSQYYVSPTAETSSGLVTAVNGILTVQGARVATLTACDLSIKSDQEGVPVVGSNVYADIVEGRVMVDGSFTAVFDSATVRDYFYNETEIALALAITTSGSAAAEFIALSMPRIKVKGADKSDGEKALIQTFPFQALENTAGGVGTSSEASTIVIQDSLA